MNVATQEPLFSHLSFSPSPTSMFSFISPPSSFSSSSYSSSSFSSYPSECFLSPSILSSKSSAYMTSSSSDADVLQSSIPSHSSSFSSFPSSLHFTSSSSYPSLSSSHGDDIEGAFKFISQYFSLSDICFSVNYIGGEFSVFCYSIKLLNLFLNSTIMLPEPVMHITYSPVFVDETFSIGHFYISLVSIYVPFLL